MSVGVVRYLHKRDASSTPHKIASPPATSKQHAVLEMLSVFALAPIVAVHQRLLERGADARAARALAQRRRELRRSLRRLLDSGR